MQQNTQPTENTQSCTGLQTSNQVLTVILECNKSKATHLTAELQEMRQILEEEGDADSSLFLKVLQVQPLCPTWNPDHRWAYPLMLITLQTHRVCFSTRC